MKQHNKMKNTSQKLATVLENGFKIERKGTKHKKEFISNSFSRPMTISTLFQILAHQGIEKSMHEAHAMTCRTFAADYHTNTKSDVHLNVSFGHAHIVFKNGEHLNINLSFGRLCDMFNWFHDEDLFVTDFKS